MEIQRGHMVNTGEQLSRTSWPLSYLNLIRYYSKMTQNRLHREPNLKYCLGMVNNIRYFGDLTELTTSASKVVQNI